MTTLPPFPSQSSFSLQPPAVPGVAIPKPPSGKWYLLGWGILAATIIGCICLAMPLVREFSELLDLRPLHSPGTTIVHLDKPGGYAIYQARGSPTSRRDSSVRQPWEEDMNISVLTREGRQLALREGDPNTIITVNGQRYFPLKVFTLDLPGDVVVTVDVGHPEQSRMVDLALGPEENSEGIFKAVTGFFLIIIIGIIGGGSALAIFLVVLVKRSRAKKQMIIAQAYNPPPL